MNFSFCIQRSICKTSLIDPLHLCLTRVSEQELAKEGFGVEKGDLAELCLNDRSQTSSSRASPGWSSCSTCRTTFEGWEGSSLLPFPSLKVKLHFGGVGFLCAGGGRAEHLRRQHLDPSAPHPLLFTLVAV